MGLRGPKSHNELNAIAHRHAVRSQQHAAITTGPLGHPPDHLSRETKIWWAQIAEDFELQPHQHRILQAAGEAWDRKEQARLALAKHGLTYEDDKGMIRPRPEIGIERDGRTSFMRAVRELDLEKAPMPDLSQAPWHRDRDEEDDELGTKS